MPRLILYFYVASFLFLSGCANIYQEEIGVKIKKDVFIFFDGTANDPKSKTNVWKLYQIVKNDNKKNTAIKYIEGVGTKDKLITGLTLGAGMEERILLGYEYLIKEYNPGDTINIVGFSRGSHQARALAGFISYAGIPIIKNPNFQNLRKLSKRIIKITKSKNDEDYTTEWLSGSYEDKPILYSEIKRKLDVNTQSASINFLGVWDTVPGSSFKDFGACKEGKDRKNGDRYKSDSYPNIKHIAHALSIDEKRSKFSPLLICEAMNKNETKIVEFWFPGAHADVGGGYGDEKGLSGVSLKWMLNQLRENYTFQNPIEEIDVDFKGLAHWSVGDPPANFGSSCVDRLVPEGADIHGSVENRKKAGMVPIRINGKFENKPYPLLCADFR